MKEKTISRKAQRWRCPECCQNTEVVVERDGNVISTDELMDVPAPTKEDKRIFLYNDAREETPIEWYPETLELTSLPGIAEATAETIGGRTTTIDDLMIDGEIKPEILRDIPTSHTALQDELLNIYTTAMDNRSDDDLELLARIRSEDHRQWWQPRYTIGGDDRLSQLRNLINYNLEEGMQFTLRFRDVDGTYRGTVEAANLFNQVTLVQEVDGLGSEGELATGSGYLPRMMFTDVSKAIALTPEVTKDIVEFEIRD